MLQTNNMFNRRTTPQESWDEELGIACLFPVVNCATRPKVLLLRLCYLCKKPRQTPAHCALRSGHYVLKDWVFCGSCGLGFMTYLSPKLDPHLVNCNYRLDSPNRCTCHPYLIPKLVITNQISHE